jgi:hypothetical protein
MKTLLRKLQADYPEIAFVEGEAFYWSPADKSVTYSPIQTEPEIGQWSLLHEVSHGILGHERYQSDFELMKLEVEAWHHAKRLARRYGVQIDAEHIEDCLDTYRDWLHRRSTCSTVSLQKDPKTYQCHNCKTQWHVSSSRFCRPYRKVARA